MTIIRKLTGYATTAAPDKVGDRVLAEGVTFERFPVPLLAAHKPEMPIGTVVGAKKAGDGYVITAYLFPPGENTDADNFATAARHGAASSFSIGFRGVGRANEHGGKDYTTTVVHEVSLVVAPCNLECRAHYSETDDGADTSKRPASVKPQANKPMPSGTEARKRAQVHALQAFVDESAAKHQAVRPQSPQADRAARIAALMK